MRWLQCFPHLSLTDSSVNITSGLWNKRKSKHNTHFKNSGYKGFYLEIVLGFKVVNLWEGLGRISLQICFRHEIRPRSGSLVSIFLRPAPCIPKDQLGDVQYNYWRFSTTTAIRACWEGLKLQVGQRSGSIFPQSFGFVFEWSSYSQYKFETVWFASQVKLHEHRFQNIVLKWSDFILNLSQHIMDKSLAA